MKTTIYYFTGCGNSLHAANLLSKKLGDTDVVPIAATYAAGAPVTSDGRIGIVFPVYMFRPPRIVCRFIRRITKAHSIFAIATMGGASGIAIETVRGLLRKNRLELAAGFTLPMPDNYTPFKGAMSDEEQQSVLQKAAEKIDTIAESLAANKRLFEKDTTFFARNLWPGIWYWLGYLMIPQLGRQFRAESNCTGCGLCAR
ncbi:MAG: EFR1 family ferrodoxin, partial [Chitinivibrionales bacterium]|nr:EFR1 family ferrodoxin [Chitinivibrionales bacterium]